MIRAKASFLRYCMLYFLTLPIRDFFSKYNNSISKRAQIDFEDNKKPNEKNKKKKKLGVTN